MKLKFSGFTINKLKYSYQSDLIEEQEDYYLNFDLGDIEITTSEDAIIINLSGEVNCKTGKANNSKCFRTIELNVDYFYEINKDKDLKEKDIKKVIENYAINNSVVMFENLVKNITSLDYTEPINVDDFEFPGGLSSDD